MSRCDQILVGAVALARLGLEPRGATIPWRRSLGVLLVAPLPDSRPVFPEEPRVRYYKFSGAISLPGR